jgi:hypothetical protein
MKDVLHGMKHTLRLLIALLLAPLAALHAADADQLAWPQPTRDAKPWTAWCWMGSAVDKATITREMTEFQKARLGGVEVGMFYGAKGAEEQPPAIASPSMRRSHLLTIGCSTSAPWRKARASVSTETLSAPASPRRIK